MEDAAALPGGNGCSTAEGDDWKRLWKNAASWQDFLDTNRAFLRGEMSQSPYYRGKISEETKPLVEGLLKLHDYGLLTYSSQPATSDRDAYYVDCPCCDKGEYRQFKQRAFLSFLFPARLLGTDIGIKFCEELSKEEDIHMSVLVYRHFCGEGCCRIGADVLNNFPKEWATHMFREAATYQKAVESDFESRQFFDVYCGKILDRFIDVNSDVTRQANPFVYHILAKDWEPCDIAQRVAAAAERAGLSSALLENAGHGIEEDDEEYDERE